MWSSHAISSSGQLYSWGWNGYGQLGLEHNLTQISPTIVPGISNAIQVAAGHSGAGVLLADGSVWAWGRAEAGALGNGIIPENTYRPVDPGLSNIKSIGAGYDGSAFVDQTGHVWATGSSNNWEFYNPILTGASTLNTPARSSYTGVRHAPARNNNTEYELMEDGRVRFAGSSSYVPNLASISIISTWGWAGAAIRDDGTLWTWAQNDYGNALGLLGDGTTISRPDARKIQDLPDIASVSVSDVHMLAASTSGTVFAWGNGSDGKLRDGTQIGYPTPKRVSLITNAVKVAAGKDHSIALLADGSVRLWGSNSAGQIGNGKSRSESPILVIAPGGLSRSQTLSHAAANGINWFTSHFSESELMDLAISGDNADPDGDGLSNLIHWKLTTDDGILQVGPSNPPNTQPSQGPRHLTAEITRLSIRPDVSLTVEFSENLQLWYGETDAWAENISSDPLLLRFRAKYSTQEKTQLFGRIVASRKPE